MPADPDWDEVNSGNASLKDEQRSERLDFGATHGAGRPPTNSPQPMPNWSDLQTAYSLLDGEEVTYRDITRPHRELCRQPIAGRCLVMGDTTELNCDFASLVWDSESSGDGGRQSVFVRSGLMVDAQSKDVIGLAGQVMHRCPSPKRKSKKSRPGVAQCNQRLESAQWCELIDQIGPPPPDGEWIYVLDSSSDSFEVYCHMLHQSNGWVVHSEDPTRNVVVGRQQACVPLSDYLAELPISGTDELLLPARLQRAARSVKLEVRVGSIRLELPRQANSWVKQFHPQPIPMNVVYGVEVDPPTAVKSICWILLTSLQVSRFDQAWRVVEYHQNRWVAEEFSKSLEAGSRILDNHGALADRLEAMVGLTSVATVRLLQLRRFAHSSPMMPAQQVVPTIWLRTLNAAIRKPQSTHELSIAQFYREVAKLGGFLGRKCDGEPGWGVAWRGWNKLNHYVHAIGLSTEQREAE